MLFLFPMLFFMDGFNFCLKLSHFLVTGSEEMKNGYAEHHNLSPDKIKVMPNWINLERFKPKKRHFSSKDKIHRKAGKGFKREY